MQRRLTLRWALLIALVIAIFLSMGMGAVFVSPIDALLGDSLAWRILLTYRIPRTLVGALVGASLSVSGAIMQALVRNPLADPHITGVSAGAGLMAVLALLALPAFPMTLLPAAALVGGIGAGVLVYLVAYKGGVNPGRLALSGIAVSAVLGAGTSALLLRYALTANAAVIWLAGGLWGRSWEHLSALAPWALPALAAAWLLGRRIDVLSLGDDIARGLGMWVERERVGLLALAVLLAASAVSVAGPIGFVGLVVPHLSRLLAGGEFRQLMPVAALVGATLVVMADGFGRTLFAPLEVPAGVITALIGAPYFLYLLRRASV